MENLSEKLYAVAKKSETFSYKHNTAQTLLMDCMDLLSITPDYYFDLAIVDPPYGKLMFRNSIQSPIQRMDAKITPGSAIYKLKTKDWNITPPKEYFDLLLKKAKVVIVWGGNYFTDKLPPSRSWIIWDKPNLKTNSFGMGVAELAWSNSIHTIKRFTQTSRYNLKNSKCKKNHPCQKPIELYSQLIDFFLPSLDGHEKIIGKISNIAKTDIDSLDLFAAPSAPSAPSAPRRILDTHLGSCTHAIAALEHLGDQIEFIGCEINEFYYKEGCELMNEYLSQKEMF